MAEPESTEKPAKKHMSPMQFFLRGLALSLPPILTIVIVIWIGRGINEYLLEPASATVRYVFAQFIDDSVDVSQLQRPAPPEEEERVRSFRLVQRNYLVPKGAFGPESPEDVDESMVYVPLGPKAVPYQDYFAAAADAPPGETPNSALAVYMALAEQRYFGSVLGLNLVAVCLIIMLLYFLGRFVSARIGAWAVNKVETEVLGRLPVIRNVYGSAKQVTDFLFSENQVEYRRVVAVEYPRKGIWSLALVTGEGMLDIATAIGEPCVSILVPSSPMPVTGYTMVLPRSSVMDLNLTVDQAFQFCISCGVLVPPKQKVTPEMLRAELTRRLTAKMEGSGSGRAILLPADAKLDDPRPTGDSLEEPPHRNASTHGTPSE